MSTIPEDLQSKLMSALKNALRTDSIKNISVSKLCQDCNISRQTFYRHYSDKFDFINQYFDSIFIRSFEEMYKGRSILESLQMKLNFIRQEQLFFAAAFRYDEQNSLRDHDFTMLLQFYCDLITKLSGTPPTKRIYLLLQMYCQSSLYITINWVLSACPETANEMVDLLLAAMPPELHKLFSQLGTLD